MVIKQQLTLNESQLIRFYFIYLGADCVPGILLVEGVRDLKVIVYLSMLAHNFTLINTIYSQN